MKNIKIIKKITNKKMDNNGQVKVYVVVALLLGLLSGYYYGSTSSYNKGLSAGDTKARAEVKAQLEAKRIIEPAPSEVRVMSGTIKSIGNNQFVLESQTRFDPTSPEGQQSKTMTKAVIVTPATQISVRIVETNSERPKAGEPFRPFVVKNMKADFKSLKMSDQVVVEAGENIADKTSFEAVSVFKNGR